MNDEKYIKYKENGTPIFTEYARHHMDEFCIAFNIKVSGKSNDENVGLFNFCYLCKDYQFGNITFQASVVKSNNAKVIDKAAIMKEQHGR